MIAYIISSYHLLGDSHLQNRVWHRTAEVALSSIKLSKSKVGDSDLASSSIRTGLSPSSDASESRPAMRGVVSRSDEEGLGGIIFWLDAVRNSEVEQQPARNHDSAGQSACRRINSST